MNTLERYENYKKMKLRNCELEKLFIKDLEEFVNKVIEEVLNDKVLDSNRNYIIESLKLKLSVL